MKARILSLAGLFTHKDYEVGDIVDVTEDDGSYYITDDNPQLPTTYGFLGTHYELVSEEEALEDSEWFIRSDKVVAQSTQLNTAGSNEVYPDNNPKATVGETKCPLHLVPPALSIGVAEAMKNGADKYGAYNFRDSKIAASVYMGAILRHLYAWWDGEDNAQDSGINHLKHIGASIGLMLDAEAAGTFVDDRPTKGGAAKLLEDYVTDTSKS